MCTLLFYWPVVDGNCRTADCAVVADRTTAKRFEDGTIRRLCGCKGMAEEALAEPGGTRPRLNHRAIFSTLNLALRLSAILGCPRMPC